MVPKTHFELFFEPQKAKICALLRLNEPQLQKVKMSSKSEPYPY